MIKFLDLKAVNDVYQSRIDDACQKVVKSGWYINGEEVKRFEKAFAAFCGTEYAIGVGNGLDALSLTLKAWLITGKLEEGDEVIVPANTFIATALAVTNNRLKLILVDINPSTFNMCTTQLKQAITQKTKGCNCSPFVWTTRGYGRN